MATHDLESTGIKSLDEILQSLRKGDNVVWQVDNIKSYLHYVDPYIKQALADGKNIIYIRFAKHPPLLSENKKIKVYQLDAAYGFESFSKQVHEIVAREGEGAFYLFDCLSDLLLDWATDLMIGNFFLVTCPFLFKLDTIAYFAILRNNHSFKTIARIRETTQLLLDVYDYEDRYYLHPLKVWNRYSPTMFLPHLEEGGKYIPIINSTEATRLFSYMSVKREESAERNLDYWDRLFLKSQELESEPTGSEEKNRLQEQLSRIMIGRETRMLSLVKENFTLEDLIAIKARMIGTGFIGGKAVGMLLARKILLRDPSQAWQNKLEPHDSFFIGSDVFYTYIVENGWWDLWLEQKTTEGYFSKAAELREKMLRGKFPEEIKEQFHQVIEYFGQSPIILRSSSLLEDSFGNAFAGKYESIFLVNQGSPEQRYKHFEETVREIFASTLNEDALSYRLQRGLGQQDEQMALLVQRVSGTHYQKYFIPFLAGVGISYNTFVWHEDMDPAAGMLWLVFGLGTREVNRVEGDYPAIIALDTPKLRPYAGTEDLKKFSQREVDVLYIEENALQTIPLDKLLENEPDLKLDLIGKRDLETEEKMKGMGISGKAYVLTFDQLLSRTDFVDNLQNLLKTLEKNYQYPVDVEFTVNFTREGMMQINLLQCRPLQAKGSAGRVKFPEKMAKEKMVFESRGNFMGGNIIQSIQRMVFVDPEAYSNLLFSGKYEIARLIGKLNKQIEEREKLNTLLIGPGRWGTRDPSLGIPVKFAEINKIAGLIEIDDPERGFTPELSFGSHFFLDLVETDIFYAALFLGSGSVFFNKPWLDTLPNRLAEALPEAAALEKVLKVYDFAEKPLRLLADVTLQKVVCLQS